ncbi:Cu,Zn superoxide dismutase-like protein [Diplogelasinospora grovesii]|uniref:superoxide dismutase n=1 Tax=Diplogelasinospora grovesii TaxID=303347 RepID=A0AAN6NDL4_9PEZI|nr:Cu,Zn superoxide dismutase-like protein [Diplogelasinospora grovesii]
MHVSIVTLLGAAALVTCQGTNGTVVTGKLGDARPVTNNPVVGEVWVANFAGTVKGLVTAKAAAIGVNYTIDVTGLPAGKGPFKYHVHLDPVPSDGNCTGTGGHLDPYQREDLPACNGSTPAKCEVGDLSGKYGTLAGPSANKTFNDPYSALNRIDLGWIGNRAIVFHDASSARIACANLTKAA